MKARRVAEIEREKDTGRGAESKATSSSTYLELALLSQIIIHQGTFYNSRDDDQDQLQLI